MSFESEVVYGDDRSSLEQQESSSAEETPIATFSILSRIDAELGRVDSRPRNIASEDSILEEKYNLLMKQLNQFLHDAKAYEKQFRITVVAQQKMAKSLKDLAQGYPIANEMFPKNTNRKSPIQFWDKKHTLEYLAAFTERVISYGERWYNEVSQRVKRGRVDTRKYLGRLTHYHKKVDLLQRKYELNPNLQAKLERNCNKLQRARDAHELHRSRLTYILREVTEHGWKELYVLLKAILQLEWETAMAKFDDMGLNVADMEQALDASYAAACQQVTPVQVEVMDCIQPSASTTSASSDDDDDDDEEIEVILAPKNHYRKPATTKLSSTTSPKGIADIEHL